MGTEFIDVSFSGSTALLLASGKLKKLFIMAEAGDGLAFGIGKELNASFSMSEIIIVGLHIKSGSRGESSMTRGVRLFCTADFMNVLVLAMFGLVGTREAWCCYDAKSTDEPRVVFDFLTLVEVAFLGGAGGGFAAYSSGNLKCQRSRFSRYSFTYATGSKAERLRPLIFLSNYDCVVSSDSTPLTLVLFFVRGCLAAPLLIPMDEKLIGSLRVPLRLPASFSCLFFKN